MLLTQLRSDIGLLFELIDLSDFIKTAISLASFQNDHQLVEIYHCIMTGFENQTPLTLTFCDVSKAFDRFWNRGLIYKLEKYDVRGDI
jgi:hypothetical protein